jgi:cytochrome d ubiquinol oxidase subunit I
MGTSLAFHFVFATIGVGLPVLMIVAEGLWLRTGDRRYYRLARTWSRALLVLFAIGAVSGTTLAFELGLLWPIFMKNSGAVIGIPFSIEGFAFFIEAIFVGIYLYGWDRLSPVAHWLCSFPLAISGALSAASVVSVNAWMNTPVGFRMSHGVITDVDPWAAIFNPATPSEVLHTTLAAYVFVGFAAAAAYAVALLRNPRDGDAALAVRIGMLVALVTIPLQLVAGDFSARFDAHSEPLKLASEEGQFPTQRGAPLRIGGLPDAAAHTTRFAIEIPRLLSFLAYDDFDAEVRGIDAFSAAEQPPVATVHLAFDVMVGSGFALLAIALWWALATRLGGRDTRAPLQWALVASGFLALVAMEAGWLVTEEGRQPWIVVGLWRTSDAVTTAPALDIAFYGFSLIYVLLAVTLAWLFGRIYREPVREKYPLESGTEP